MNIDNIVISDIKRECIACPASWSAETVEGGNVYLRFRGGRMSLRHRGPNEDPDHNRKDSLDSEYVSSENEIFSDSSFGHIEGYMSPFELKEYLRDKGVRFSDCLDKTFYGDLEPSDCDFLLIGDWFKLAECDQCQWSIKEDLVEQIQYETVVPEVCPKCQSDVSVETEKPERFEHIEENI